MKSAFYHQEGKAPKSFAVLKEHSDGTLDIGPEGGPAVVTGCAVSEEAKSGCVTLVISKDNQSKSK